MHAESYFCDGIAFEMSPLDKQPVFCRECDSPVDGWLSK